VLESDGYRTAGGLGGRFRISNLDANLFLTQIGVTGGTNYSKLVPNSNEFLPATHVHLDPFGCVTNFLDSAVSALDLRADRARATKVTRFF